MQFAHAQEVTKPVEPTKPHISAQIVGMNEDDSGVIIRLSEPAGRRVRRLEGFLSFRNDKGRELPSAPGVHYSFGAYPFDRLPTCLMTVRVPKDAAAFRQMVRGNLANARPQFDITHIEFDEYVDVTPRRIVKRHVSKDREVTFEYAIQEEGVIFAGRVVQRWGKAWLIPWHGLRVTDVNDQVIRTMSFKVSPPLSNPEPQDKLSGNPPRNTTQWRLSMGMKNDASITHVEESMTFKEINVTSSYTSGPVDAQSGETMLTMHDMELPLLLPGVEAHWIPFRYIDGKAESFVILFARDTKHIQDIIKTIPLWDNRQTDWDRLFASDEK